MLFNAIVLSHFDYYSQVWTNASKTYLLHIINKIHKRDGMMLLHVPKGTPTEEALSHLKSSKVEERRQQQRLCLVHKIGHGNAAEYLNSYACEVRKHTHTHI